MQRASPRIALNRHELSGAFGDIGTDLPLLIALVAAADLDAGAVFLMFGLAQIATGLVYGLPMPMQPLKAMAVIVITERLAGPTLFGGGLAIGATMLVLAGTGLLDWLARVIPAHVVRGVQLGLALSLANLALKSYVPAMGWPGFGLAAASFALIVALKGNRHLPPALPVIVLGIAFALWWPVDGAALRFGISLHLPTLQVPQLADIATGFVVLALPQIPLSLSNSVIATEKTVRDLFPDKPVSVRRIGLTYGLANLVLPFFGAVPLCHGCGGLAGHHAFGGRTGGSVLIYGALYVAIGLFFSGGAGEVVRLFPYPMLGVILLFEALALATLLRDVMGSRRDLTLALLVALLAAGLPQGYVVGLLVGTALTWLSDRYGLLREPEA
ncbi:MAG TPA: putative sulfate/molybdate transporter [bacterium]